MDLHDELGAELARITLLCHAVLHAPHLPHDLRERLERMVSISRNTTATLRDIVWDLKRPAGTSTCLRSCLRGIAMDTLQDAGLEHQLRFPASAVDIPSHSPLHTALPPILKAALHNVIDHAQAKRVEVSLLLGHDHYAMVISDDGVGRTTPHPLRPGNGLRHMHARAKAIGANCSIRTGTHGGWEVRVTGPMV